mmetsp:Transcript_5032/g.15077  ORF Transcript_5032/g.15077 Transcript_5032/m.15077 type:complete len:321 (+) Transcript_5032:169-1131(+)
MPPGLVLLRELPEAVLAVSQVGVQAQRLCGCLGGLGAKVCFVDEKTRQDRRAQGRRGGSLGEGWPSLQWDDEGGGDELDVRPSRSKAPPPVLHPRRPEEDEGEGGGPAFGERQGRDHRGQVVDLDPSGPGSRPGLRGLQVDPDPGPGLGLRQAPPAAIQSLLFLWKKLSGRGLVGAPEAARHVKGSGDDHVRDALQGDQVRREHLVRHRRNSGDLPPEALPTRLGVPERGDQREHVLEICVQGGFTGGDPLFKVSSLFLLRHGVEDGRGRGGSHDAGEEEGGEGRAEESHGSLRHPRPPAVGTTAKLNDDATCFFSDEKL